MAVELAAGAADDVWVEVSVWDAAAEDAADVETAAPTLTADEARPEAAADDADASEPEAAELAWHELRLRGGLAARRWRAPASLAFLAAAAARAACLLAGWWMPWPAASTDEADRRAARGATAERSVVMCILGCCSFGC